jgi:aspartyl-tRNA(Asn)/glutamyl-tRNA(Gln) amidotransferase subunit B
MTKLESPVDATTEWETVIGLEVHTELRTATKLFCGCPNNFGDEPNTNVCPICLGLPGSLPVLNRTAVDYAVRIGTALHCTVQASQFHRKNYFYPDQPKDYQISQYDLPLNADGWLELPNGKRIGVERAHMEEDTGKNTHIGGGGGRIAGADHSLVDYNRAGVPLVEIVSRPDLRSAEEARAYVDELRAILVASGASDGKMEEGSLRVDANVSVRPLGGPLGTRCEIKNMNSLRSLGRAIDYEVARQIALITDGGTVDQETRHWDENTGRTSTMRSKEQAEDYRYFPEPDLVPLAPGASWIDAVAAALPPMPADRRAAVAAASGLSSDSESVITVVHLDLDRFVDAAVTAGVDAALAVRRLQNEVAASIDSADTLDAEAFVALVGMEERGELTTAQARTVLRTLLVDGGDPAAIAESLGFEALGAGALGTAVDEAIAANPGEWGRFVGGEDKLTGFFIGKIKAATGGNADLKEASALLRERRAAAS